MSIEPYVVCCMQPLSLLEKLPVELIYEIQLSALSESLPIVNKRAYEIFDCTHPSYRAEYIYLRCLESHSSFLPSSYALGGLLTYALQYPLCTETVLDALVRLAEREGIGRKERDVRPLLPKRLFKYLCPRIAPAHYTHDTPPLPFLLYLYAKNHESMRPPDPNAYEGYALARAVHAGHTMLVKFLLRQGAKPELKDALAVRIAIKKHDLGVVRTLIEREAEEEGEVETYSFVNDSKIVCDRTGRGGVFASEVRQTQKRRKSAKRRRVEDRVEVTTAMLRLAVEADARDIVQYFLEKGARPDLLTIQRMRRIGFV